MQVGGRSRADTVRRALGQAKKQDFPCAERSVFSHSSHLHREQGGFLDPAMVTFQGCKCLPAQHHRSQNPLSTHMASIKRTPSRKHRARGASSSYTISIAVDQMRERKAQYS